MKIKEYLPKLKANRWTYGNLDKKAIADYQSLYNYLKKHQDKDVAFQYDNSLLKIDDLIKTNPIKVKNKYGFTEVLVYNQYLSKYRAMEILSQNIAL